MFATVQHPPLQPMFVPFMLGTISLIAFLSVRNTYLAGAIRHRCEDVRKTKCSVSEASYFLQMLYFLKRYHMSNRALIASIAAIVFFGSMIAVDILFPVAGEWPWSTHSITCIMMIVGGASATYATWLCLFETWIARKSLFTEVATSIVTADHKIVEPSLLSTFGAIERMIGSHLDATLHGKLLATRSRLELSIKSTKTPNTDQELDQQEPL